MKKIIDYQIVLSGADELEEFETEVKDNIAKGWQPIGAPYECGKDLSYMAQAMVKYES
jgi:hypothetical protein